MKVGVFHPGTQHSWQTAQALQELGRLKWYATSIFYQPDRWPYRFERLPAPIGPKLRAEFRRFSHPALDPGLVHTAGVAEWFERLAARAGAPRLAQRIDRWGNRRFVDAIGGLVTAGEPVALWGYNSSSLTTFELARARGRPCILDRTIGDYRAYNAAMAPLRVSHAEWFTPAYAPVTDEAIARDDREYDLADVIVCGARHAAETIAQNSPVPGVAHKLRTLPYCFDEQLFGHIAPPARVPRDRPVRFLFVGQLSMRKGIHHVLEAIERLPSSGASLTLVGSLDIPKVVFARFADRVSYFPTVPRFEMPAIMAAHDVLVFPSYFEGSALSLLEGLASGLALIQTPQAGNGVTPQTGISLARPDTALLAEAMMEAVEHRDRLDAWRAAAQGEARNYTFARYRDNIASLLAEMGI